MISLKSYSSKTNQGPYLQNNEDDVDVDLVNNLYMIFDGFGGVGIGDRLVEKLKQSVRSIYTHIGGDPDSTFPFFYSPKYLIEGNALINAMNHGHSEALKFNEGKGMGDRGGASGIVAGMSEQIMTFASVGNCVAYLFRKGILEPIILPDSLSALSRDSFQSYYQTAPMSGFGLFEDFHLQVRELRIHPGDQIIFLTDGAYARLERRELKYILGQGGLSDMSKIEEIFTTVNQRGNLDNQSAVLLHF